MIFTITGVLDAFLNLTIPLSFTSKTSADKSSFGAYVYLTISGSSISPASSIKASLSIGISYAVFSISPYVISIGFEISIPSKVIGILSSKSCPASSASEILYLFSTPPYCTANLYRPERPYFF